MSLTHRADSLPSTLPSKAFDSATMTAIRQLFDSWREEIGEPQKMSAETVPNDDLIYFRKLYAARRARDKIFPNGMFADPAWDILIDLYIASIEGRQISVTSACIAACVPPTTALRYIARLEELKFVTRRLDYEDGRRIFLALTPQAQAALREWAMVTKAAI